MQVMDVDTSIHTPARTFSHHDRCDRCGFQAYYVAQKGGKELLFCAHHGNEHKLALDFYEWKVFDFTAELDPVVIVDKD